MENNFDVNIEEKELNPWFSIWTKPRQTTRQLLKKDVGSKILILAALAGISQSLDQASSNSLGDNTSILFLVIGALIIGSISGIIMFYIECALIKWTGKWLGGKATSEELQVAVAYGNIPLICSMVLWIPAYLIFGNELFITYTPAIDGSFALTTLYLVYGLIEMVIGIWAIVVSVKCIAEAQGFTSWRAFGNVLLSAAVILVPLLLIVMLIGVLTMI